MKIAIMGSGGLGGLYGARLASAGCHVSFVARGSHLAAIRRDGLTVESDAYGTLTLRDVNVTEDPATIGVVDYVLLAVKLWDTESAAKAIMPLIGPSTAVLSLQNGVIKDDILRRAVGEAPVMGAVAYVATLPGCAPALFAPPPGYAPALFSPP
jgi:2-dehydropantoate 2-reductase